MTRTEEDRHKEIDEKIDKLYAIHEEYEECTKCGLCDPAGRKRRHVVTGEGYADAEVMIIGEAPGEYEDLQSRPFSPDAPVGELVEKFLRSFEIERDDVYLDNVAACRPTLIDDPRKNRSPVKEEIAACIGRLHRTIEIVDPYVILLLGKLPLKALTSCKSSITALSRNPDIPMIYVDAQGQTLTYPRPAYATFHPSYLLRNESDDNEGSDSHKSFLTWEKAIKSADMCALIYERRVPPLRTEKWNQFPEDL